VGRRESRNSSLNEVNRLFCGSSRIDVEVEGAGQTRAGVFCLRSRAGRARDERRRGRRGTKPFVGRDNEFWAERGDRSGGRRGESRRPLASFEVLRLVVAFEGLRGRSAWTAVRLE